jgi:hypothetical protein
MANWFLRREDKWTKSMFAKIVENELPLMSTKTKLSVLSANPYPRKKRIERGRRIFEERLLAK